MSSRKKMDSWEYIEYYERASSIWETTGDAHRRAVAEFSRDIDEQFEKDEWTDKLKRVARGSES